MSEEPAPPQRDAPAAAGPAPVRAERPAFARAYPETPAVDALLALFERGDYASLRRGAGTLMETGEPDERRAAALLLKRTEADPFAKLVLLLTLALLAWVTYHWETHDGKRNLVPDQPAQQVQAAPSP